MRYLYLIDALFMSLILCVSVESSLDKRTTSSISEFNKSPQPFNVVTDSQDEARIAQGPTREPQSSSSFLKQQNGLERQELSHLPLDNKASKGKKRKLSIDLNLPPDISWTESGNESPNHRKAMDQTEESTVPNQGAGIYIDKSWDTVPSNPPHDVTSDHEEARVFESPAHPSKKFLTDRNKSGIPDPLEEQPSLPSSSRDKINVYQNELHEQAHIGKYTFKINGKSVLLADQKVRKIGNHWHMIPLSRHIMPKLTEIGWKLAIKNGLHQESEKLAPWFLELLAHMQVKSYHDNGTRLRSREIYGAVYKTNRYIAMHFLASLQIIHSPDPQQMKDLVHDGWNFLKGFLANWKQVSWRDGALPSIDTTKCLEIHSPLQLLGYMMKTSQTVQLSLRVIWSLCNNWYDVSIHKNKKRIGSFEDFSKEIHLYLAGANLLPEFEVVPCNAPRLVQGESSSSQTKITMYSKRLLSKEIRLENISVDSNRHKRVVAMIKEVGTEVLQRSRGTNWQLGFIENYCNHMRKKKVEWPNNWKGSLSSVERRVKDDVFPSFLGMIWLLDPLASEKGQTSFFIIKGNLFLGKLLKGWGEDDLERACQMKCINVKKIDGYDEISVALLAYLLKLNHHYNTEIASSVYWGLWKVWKEGEGHNFAETNHMNKYSDFIEAVENTYVKQVHQYLRQDGLISPIHAT